MSDLEVCRECQGFRPATLSACPHCNAVVANTAPGRLERLCRAGVQVATGGALAMTLMACYGSPHSMHEPMSPEPNGDCSEGEMAQDPNGVCSDDEKPMTMAGEGEGDDVKEVPGDTPPDGEGGDSEPVDGEAAQPDAP